MSEWIKHTGATNPVPDTVVEVYLNTGEVFVENSEDLIWAQPIDNEDGAVVFYRVVKESNTDFNESISKDALKLVLTNALIKHKNIDSLYDDLLELL